MNPENKFNARKKELYSQITKLISKEGFSNLTVRDICRELGISIGTFYHYFPEKGDIAWILFSDIDKYFSDEVATKFVDYEPDNLITYCMEYGNYVISGGLEICRYISIAPFHNKKHTYLDENRSLFQILLKILMRGVAKEQFHLNQSPLETAKMLMILLRGYSADWAKRDGDYNIVDKIEDFIKLFIKSLI
jgi:AcrR family transcriptional regulator